MTHSSLYFNQHCYEYVRSTYFLCTMLDYQISWKEGVKPAEVLCRLKHSFQMSVSRKPRSTTGIKYPWKLLKIGLTIKQISSVCQQDHSNDILRFYRHFLSNFIPNYLIISAAYYCTRQNLHISRKDGDSRSRLLSSPMDVNLIWQH